MNVSGISAYSPSFGQVKRSAAEKAIESCNGDIGKISRVKQQVEDQKDNYRYDIKGLGPREYYNYIVVKRGENSGMCYMTLDEACYYANRSAAYEEIKEASERKKQEHNDEFNKIADSVLEDCPDD